MTPEKRAQFKADLWLVLKPTRYEDAGYEYTFNRLAGSHDFDPSALRGLTVVSASLNLWKVADRAAFLQHLVELRGEELVSWALLELELEET